MKTVNKYTRSERAEQQAAHLNRHPAQYLIELVNLYHSVPRLYFPTEDGATQAKLKLKNEITEVCKDVPDVLRFKIEASLKSERLWEDLRNKIF